ncbi:hypothetical protein [Wenzhouxiangella marina]|uniref:Uncharacterized protein n=1 Tax=Wenzhouxiangella marina TaxID=1579979 RepID=A0A0K0XZM8_9GAMM|nr:hypothetical protein [Wenzhouxiangella marina]AKS43125.1 hypothetical protein WM2015_2768 [Wenzhouxiangella marina]MBB6087190.1 hypothetical protein [Wenzhouxiangella marina]
MNESDRPNFRQRLKALWQPSTLKKWLSYTLLGTCWLLVFSALFFSFAQDRDAPIPLLRLLVVGVVCFVLAALGTLPLILQEGLDGRGGRLGCGFLIGILVSFLLLMLAFRLVLG